MPLENIRPSMPPARTIVEDEPIKGMAIFIAIIFPLMLIITIIAAATGQ